VNASVQYFWKSFWKRTHYLYIHKPQWLLNENTPTIVRKYALTDVTIAMHTTTQTNPYYKLHYPIRRLAKNLAALAVMLGLVSCSWLPTSGPSTKAILSQGDGVPSGLQLVDVTPEITRQLSSQKLTQGFGTAFGPASANPRDILVGVGDTLEVNIWEAPPATLFGAADATARGAGATGASRNTTLPEQTIVCGHCGCHWPQHQPDRG
jgi:hypothetical protein